MEKSEKEEFSTVRLKSQLVIKISKYISESDEFSNVEDFLEFIVLEALKSLSSAETSSIPPEEEEEIKERLRNLGYM